MSDETALAKLEQRTAEIRATDAHRTTASKLGDELPADLGAQRLAHCEACGGEYTQTRMLNGWAPAHCASCRGATLQQLGVVVPSDEAARLRLELLAVPPKYAAASIDNFQLHGETSDRNRQSRLLIMARRYLAEWPNVPDVVVFRGGPGSGKGHLAWSIVKTLVGSYDVQARVVKLGDTIRDLREAWRSEGGLSEAQRLERYRKPNLLVVDEVSRHAFYGEPHRHLYDLIDHRLEWCRPTILTTNEEPAAFADLLGPALTSRVASTGLWEFGELDYRLTTGRRVA